MAHVGMLRCEYLPDAMGVDTPEPRFSWQLIDPDQQRGRSQGAYQLQVERVIGKVRKTLWDSGKVASDRSVNIAYAGEPLRAADVCSWRVRVWDEHDTPTEWSDGARFVMGLLGTDGHDEHDDWQGDWIRSGEAEDHQHIWFRKSFALGQVPGSAIAYVCSIGYHELYINGQRIGDAVLSPGVTNLAKRALYMTYDITHALRPGENVIAMWTGPGWARADGSYGKGVWDQSPMCRAMVHLTDAEPIVTDTTWRCATSCSENIGLWNGGGQGTYGGERIDARRHIADWHAVAFDDSTWRQAVTGEQRVALSSALFEPDRKVRTLRPVKIEKIDGQWRIDFGENFTGWFEADLRGGTEGETVQVHTSNRLEVMTEYDQESEYIFDATGEGTFCHRFNWMAGRWVTLVGRIDEPTLDDVRGYLITNDRRRLSGFECSNGLLNAIYEADLRTYVSNTVNAAVMDCPHRERYGYGEVALACTWGCAVPNFESAAMYAKASRDWCDVQDDDGMVNTIAPQPYKGAGGTLWSSAPITLTWEHYRAYGDERVLAAAYPTWQRWLTYLHSAVTDDGVLMPYTHGARFLGDWATPHGNEYGDQFEAQLFNNCVYAYNLMVAVRAAEVLGLADDRALYQQRLDALRQHAHDYFFDEATGRYGDGRQMAMLFPLYVRITPEPLRDRVLDGFVREVNQKNYLDVGSPGLPILFKCVVEDWANPDVIHHCLTRTAYPSYGFFLARQESTWPEYWEVDGIRSRMHTCYTGVAGYFIRGMAGIHIDDEHPGMRRVIIRPYFPDPLTHLRATSETLYGPVAVSLKRTEQRMTQHVVVPPNSFAKVYLPAAVDDMTEGHQQLVDAPGVTLLEQNNGTTIVEVPAGAYDFAWPNSAADDPPESDRDGLIRRARSWARLPAI